MRRVDVLPPLIISGMDSRLENTTWQNVAKADDTMLLATLGHGAGGQECSAWVDFAV